MSEQDQKPLADAKTIAPGVDPSPGSDPTPDAHTLAPGMGSGAEPPAAPTPDAHTLAPGVGSAPGAEPTPEAMTIDTGSGPSSGAEATMFAQTSASMPDRIGNYTIKRVIASGGMGTVYEAMQETPRRVVALKIMKSGINSRAALRRFEYESQILGRLRHPGIAQV
ncbi:MAG: hypothetical protein ACYTGC_17360, partial [Planctomycetota bacterium]